MQYKNMYTTARCLGIVLAASFGDPRFSEGMVGLALISAKKQFLAHAGRKQEQVVRHLGTRMRHPKNCIHIFRGVTKIDYQFLSKTHKRPCGPGKKWGFLTQKWGFLTPNSFEASQVINVACQQATAT